MKTLTISIILSMIGFASFAQTLNNPVINGPSQFGSHNTQNNYYSTRLSAQDSIHLVKRINQFEVDSNLTKRCVILTIATGGNTDVYNQVINLLQQNNYDISASGDALSGIPVRGIQLGMNKMEHAVGCIGIIVGAF